MQRGGRQGVYSNESLLAKRDDITSVLHIYTPSFNLCSYPIIPPPESNSNLEAPKEQILLNVANNLTLKRKVLYIWDSKPPSLHNTREALSGRAINDLSG